MSEEPAEVRRLRGATLVDLAREDLELWGAEELIERIELLSAEIERARAQLTRKEATRAAADALFSRRD
ncbi:MAG TPA: DUF1192 domain-containing protein [Caulobacteraceae bacterium]|jgi:uncharacterized small protein (DUF1192 family)|nr:DUF1192 domain-containing protein [Caulobacteraceae bacterium]